jgi:hypothetical protein
MKQLFMVDHYPKREHEADLFDAMREFGPVVTSLPGIVQPPTVWREGGRVVAMVAFESKEALEAGQPRMAEALAGLPFDRWLQRPLEPHVLEEVSIS